MGTWGTAISSNDTFVDVYAEFFIHYNEGIDVAVITDTLLKSNKETIDDPNDSNNFWFALAKAQWECKKLDDSVFSKIENIVNSGSDIEIWRQLDADNKSLQKREIALKKFLSDLSTPCIKAKSIKEKIIQQPVYSKGDCITFKLNNDNYGGAIILEAIYNTEHAYNLIATVDINQPTKPEITDFTNSNVLIKNFGAHKDKPAIIWISPINHEQAAHLFEKIDTINVELQYDIQKSNYGFSADFNLWIIDQANNQFEYNLTNSKTNRVITIKQLIKKRKWKLW